MSTDPHRWTTAARATPANVAVILAVILTVVLVIVPGPATGQAKVSTPPTDWTALVEKAHQHRRIMVRRAVAGKIAKAGAVAIPAVLAYEKKHGRRAIRLVLVAAFAASTSTKTDNATLSLLLAWANDREFAWRSQALAALANRRVPAHRELFRQRLGDPAYLTRIQAGRGLWRLGVDRQRVLALLRDRDPRVRLRIAACLVEEDDNRGLPTLVEALRQDGEFLDYPWGRIGALVAFKTLRKLAGEPFGFTLGAPLAENTTAIDRFEKWARQRLGDQWVEPVRAHHDKATYTGGVEIRSCRNGDLFLRFDEHRNLVFGLESTTRVRLDGEIYAALAAGPRATGKSRHGKVICDYVRWLRRAPKATEKSAPGALPQETATWLESIAKALDNTDRHDLSQQISSRLDQFRTTR